MKNNALIYWFIIGLLLGSCKPELASEKTFYKIYPEKEPLHVTGVVPTCDGFLVLGFQPPVGDRAVPVPVLYRFDEAGNIIGDNLLTDTSIVGRCTNLLLAPTGDLYFGALQKSNSLYVNTPRLYRLTKDAGSCNYTLTSNDTAGGRWRMYPADGLGVNSDNDENIFPMAIAWDSAAQRVLIYTVQNKNDSPVPPGFAHISAMSTEGIPDPSLRANVGKISATWFEPYSVTDYTFSPILTTFGDFALFTTQDTSDNSSIFVNFVHAVYTGPVDSLRGLLALTGNIEHLSLFGIIPKLMGTPLYVADDSSIELSDYGFITFSRYLDYKVSAQQIDVMHVFPAAGTDVAGLVVQSMPNLRFREGNNMLMRPLGNNRHLIAGSDRNGGIELTLADGYGNPLRQNSVLNGGDFMPAAICEASNGDIIVAGSVLTFERTATLFLLRVDGPTLSLLGK